jgi:MarR family 2-MHQ and catechol resistance regulon transcriptional repressor
MANPKRQDLVQQFFETLTAVHRLVGDARSVTHGQKERRSKERRQPQTELLYILSRIKELTIKEIAAKMYITSSAATQMVESLVKQGFLERKDDPKDRRVVRVSLTSRGKAYFSRFKKEHLGRIDHAIKKLSDKELKMLIDVRNKLLPQEK